MSGLGERLTGMVVDATSSDRRVRVAVHGPGRVVEVMLHAGVYDRYTEPDLSERLEEVLRLAFARSRQYADELVDAELDAPAGGGDWYAPERRRYTAGLAAIEATGTSDDGTVRIATRALEEFRVAIAPGTLRRRPERTFGASLDTALARLIADHRSQVFRLRTEVYDLGFPPGLMELLRRRCHRDEGRP